MSATCGIDVSANLGAYTSGVDTAVTGQAAFNNSFNNCVLVSINNGCTFRIGGSSAATLNETAVTKGGVVYQDLTLSGATPTINNVSGCLGAVSNGQIFTLNAVFNIQSPDGLINLS